MSDPITFWAKVNAELPRWREVNADASFLRWLSNRSPADYPNGQTRQEHLNDARAALNADRVVAIFKEWIAQQERKS